MKTKLTHALALSIITLALFGCADQRSASDDAAADWMARIAPLICAEDIRTITPELRHALTDPDPALRAVAARSVGRIGVDDQPLDSVVALLWPLLHDSLETVATQAAFALGLLPDDSALANHLVEYAFTAPPPAAHSAIISAGRVGDSSAALTQKLAILLHHKEPGYRSRAAMALFLCGAADMSYSIIQVALNDSVKSVRDTALFALARLNEPKARDLYLRYTEDPDPYLVGLALRGLAEVGDVSLAGVVAEFLKRPDPNLRAQAITTLGRLKCKDAEEALADVVDTETDERLLALALRALAEFDARRYRKLAANQLYPDMSYGLKAAVVFTLAKSVDDWADKTLDSLVRAEPRLIGELFGALPRTLEQKVGRRFLESYLTLADGPALYAAHQFITDLDIHPKQWLTAEDLLEFITGPNDEVSKGANIEYAAQRREPWFFTVALRLAREGLSAPGPVPQSEWLDIYRSLLSATETMLTPRAGFIVTDQIRSDASEVFTLCAQQDYFVISREAAANLRRHFKVETGRTPAKPKSEYTVESLSDALSNARREAAVAVFEFDGGEVEVALDFDTAPLTCLNFIKLTQAGLYSPVIFHRVIPNFVAQGGDPRGDGWGGPGYSIRCEYSDRSYRRGTIGIATSGKDTGGSQFFFTLTPMPHLDARYTIFGQVTRGVDLVDTIRQGDRARSVRVATRTD
ncbi:MAG TPA: peptidylprolyl isomerase [candidate division Zixibacteria bacterium]|nr:peptidylprolyl isomerase [candidate division Zixibacteria bacterium]